MRELEHPQHARHADRAPADYRFHKRDRFPVLTEETIRSCRSGRGLAAVVAAQALVAFGPVEEERAPADARGLRLDQAEHHLNRDRRVERGAAAPEDVVARHRRRAGAPPQRRTACRFPLLAVARRKRRKQGGAPQRRCENAVRATPPCYGLSTTLPKISRSSIRRNASLTCESGSSLSMMGLSFPWRMRSRSAARSSRHEAVRSQHLDLERPDVAQVFLGIEAGGRAAGEHLAAAMHGPERRHPGVAAGEVDHHVDAAFESAPVRLAVLGVDPFHEILLRVVDDVVGADPLQALELRRRAGAGDHLGAGELRKEHGSSADPARCAEDQDASRRLDLADGVHHADRRAVGHGQAGRRPRSSPRPAAARDGASAPRSARRGRRAAPRRRARRAPTRSTGSIMTRSPTFQSLTPGPSAAISPAKSRPMMQGIGTLMPGMPRRVKMSW